MATRAKSRSAGTRRQRVGAAIDNTERYMKLRITALTALVDLYGHLGRLMPKRHKDREFRAATEIKRAIYRNNLRRARRQHAVVKRLRKVTLPNG